MAEKGVQDLIREQSLRHEAEESLRKTIDELNFAKSQLEVFLSLRKLFNEAEANHQLLVDKACRKHGHKIFVHFRVQPANYGVLGEEDSDRELEGDAQLLLPGELLEYIISRLGPEGVRENDPKRNESDDGGDGSDGDTGDIEEIAEGDNGLNVNYENENATGEALGEQEPEVVLISKGKVIIVDTINPGISSTTGAAVEAIPNIETHVEPIEVSLESTTVPDSEDTEKQT